MPYIDLGIETDPEALKDEAVAYIEDAVPGWVASAGNLETILLEVIAEMAAEQATVASEMPSAVFRRFGQTLVGLPPIEGVAAIGSTTWSMTDALGHTIPLGTAVEIQDQIFETTAAATIAVGVSSATIPIAAVLPGAAANGLTGAALPVDTIAFVNSVTLVGTTSGGVDAETDEEYLDRLTAELQLMAPRPIVPVDFEVMARNVAGVDRAVAIDLWDALAVSTGLTGTVTSGSPTVTAIAGGTMDSTYIGAAITGANIPAGTYVTAVPSGTSLTMSANATGTLAGTAITLTGRGGQARTLSIAAVDVNGAAVSAATKTAISDYLAARREVNFVIRVIDPSYTTIGVTSTITVLPDFDPAIVTANAAAAVRDFLQPYNFGRTFQGADNLTRPWVNTKRVGYLNVAQVIKETSGVAFIETLTLSGGIAGTAGDRTLLGAAPLTLPGTITVTQA